MYATEYTMKEESLHGFYPTYKLNQQFSNSV
jgi:hypothetical protein